MLSWCILKNRLVADLMSIGSRFIVDTFEAKRLHWKREKNDSWENLSIVVRVCTSAIVKWKGTIVNCWLDIWLYGGLRNCVMSNVYSKFHSLKSDIKKYILSHIKSIYSRTLEVYTFIPQEYILFDAKVYTFVALNRISMSKI